MNPNFFNLSKRKKPDLLTDLLIGKSTKGIISKKEINALNKFIDNPPLNNVPVKIHIRPSKKIMAPATGNKVKKKTKKTHYLSQEISENLDKAQEAICSLVPENIRSRISKSLIVDQSLVIILQEFEAKGEKSRLIHTILQKHETELI